MVPGRVSISLVFTAMTSMFPKRKRLAENEFQNHFNGLSDSSVSESDVSDSSDDD